jgi:phosphohistidine phosphatase
VLTLIFQPPIKPLKPCVSNVKTIYLLRHAKTEAGTPAQIDRDRELIPRGVEDAQALGRWLMHEKIHMDQVLVSPATRTLQTLEALNQSYNPPFTAQVIEALYLASCGDLIGQLQAIDITTESVMIIGHNPGIHQCCLTLAEEGDSQALEMIELHYSTCGLSILTTDISDWSEIAPGCAYLQNYLNRHHIAALLT